MATKWFKAKLVGSEALRALQERSQSKSDFNPNNIELSRQKDTVCDRLQRRLVEILEKPTDEEDPLIASKNRNSSWGSDQQKLKEFNEIYSALISAQEEYKEVETRHRASTSQFGQNLDRIVNNIREIKIQVDEEHKNNCCAII